MTAEEKTQIGRLAEEAAQAGIPTIESCPWPSRSEEWFHFQACYRVAGLVFEVSE